MTKVIDADKVFLTKSGVVNNWALGSSGDDFSIKLEPMIDKRIAAALRLLQDGSGTGLAKQLRSVADFIDPPAKAEVRLNPCRKCGQQPGTIFSSDFLGCGNTNCLNSWVFKNAEDWNSANPVQPVAVEKRYKPGQRFLHWGKHAYRTFMRQDGTVGIISSEGFEQKNYICVPNQNNTFTIQDLFGSCAKNWQPIDEGAQRV